MDLIFSPSFHVILIMIVQILAVQQNVFAEPDNLNKYISDHISGGLNIRLRNEYWDTFLKEGVTADEDYNFFLVRYRGYIDMEWDNFGIHLTGQGVKAFDLPENGAFGSGPIYYNASDQDKDPGNFQIVEAFLHLKDMNGFYLKGGRIPIKEGAEVLYKGDTKMNWVIKKRLSERLIGNLDWTNLGRRFDGVTGGFRNSIIDFNLFAANPTFGAFDFDDGYRKDLDTVIVSGGVLTLMKDGFVNNTQIKLFDYFYFDDRVSAREIAGDDLSINTIGASLVGVYQAGPGELDLMLWAVYQFGDFGETDQNAYAFIAETGYQLKDVSWKPWLRIGLAYASGDDDPDDSENGTFFNYLPTNHKFYGYVDANAFSNLIDLYFQFILSPHSRVNFAVDGHWFRLASDSEYQIGGSGAFNDSIFGYVIRQPVAGNDIESNLGGELDLTMIFKPWRYIDLQVGYSHFFGGRGMEVIFDEKDQLDWFYTQVTVHFESGK